MIQATTIGRLSGEQSPVLHSLVITALSAAALFVPPTYLIATPALLLLGVHLARNSSSSTNRHLGWLAIANALFVIAVVALLLLAVHSGLIVAGR